MQDPSKIQPHPVRQAGTPTPQLHGMAGSAFYNDFHNALLDYRDQRPSFDPSQGLAAYHQQMVDYRTNRPMLQNYLTNFMQPTAAPLPGIQTQQPQQPVQLPPAMPQQVTVQGAIPSSNPFQFPTY